MLINLSTEGLLRCAFSNINDTKRRSAEEYIFGNGAGSFLTMSTAKA
jgi:hypothetical protein